MEGNGLKAGVMELGKVSKYTCPDCHGVLVQIEEGPIVRFRCHTGHAFSLMTLLAEVSMSRSTRACGTRCGQLKSGSCCFARWSAWHVYTATTPKQIDASVRQMRRNDD